MSRLLDFYRGEATDSPGRFLKDVWVWDDNELEMTHDFIQWLFPMTEQSHFNPQAPRLTEEDIAAFRNDEHLQENLRHSFVRMLKFWGLALAENGEVVLGDNFGDRVPEVWAAPNHNWLRVTRILRSLTLLGLEPEAQAFFHRLEEFYHSRRFPIPTSTYSYWSGAIVP